MGKKQQINRFPRSAKARAGVIIKNLEEQKSDDDHNHAIAHRDDYYFLMLITSGRAVFKIDFNLITVASPGLLLIFPGQVHCLVEMQEPKGWVLIFDPSVFGKEMQLLMEKRIKEPLMLDQNEPFYSHAITLISMMANLQSSVTSEYSNTALRSLLDALISLIAEKITLFQPVTGLKKNKGRAAFIEQEFDYLLKQNFKFWKQPAQYAEALNISVSYLYDIIKELSETSVSSLIQQHSILEAKRLLYLTDLSIKEIAYEIGYNEPVYFGKLFKKITGLTPVQFRFNYRD